MSRKNRRILLGAILALIVYIFSAIQKNQIYQNPSISPIASSTPMPLNTPKVLSATDSAILVKVTRVTDGDTLEIEGGQKIRYIGVDTPETVDPTRPDGCFGREASDRNKELVLGKDVRLEKDVSETDKYDRLLRYVYVESPSTGSGQTSLFVNDYLVRSGYAKVSTYPPDVKYQEKFLESEKYARENNLGLWGKCL